MLRKLLGVGLLLATLAGCTKLEGRTCASNGDCGQDGLCDTTEGICYAADIEEPDGGACSPACAEYEACTRSGCRPRFTALNILSPMNNAVLTGSTDGGMDGGTVEVVAELVANPLYASTTQFPPSLSFLATRGGGGEVGSFGAVTQDAGVYSVPWTPPMAQAQFALTVAHPTPAVGLSSTVNVTVDSVPPTFEIAFSAPPTRAMGNVMIADQKDPETGFDTAFRRDESVTVTVSANETVTNVVMTVVGIGPGGSPGQTQTVELQPAGTCGASPFCRTATVEFSTLEMSAFRGTMEFRVEGQDGAGNRGSAMGGLKVTRWKWAYGGVGNIVGSPSVGARGTLYFGTNVTTGTGKIFAINPDGSRKWETTVGDVSGSPAVGAFSSGEEYVYAAARTTTTASLYALRSSDGTERAKCSYNNATEVPGALAVGTTPLTVGSAETGLGIYSGSPVRIVGIRPDALVAERCLEVSGSGAGAILASGPGSSLVMKDQTIFYATGTTGGGPRITSYDLASGTSSTRAGFPQSTSHLTRGIALSGDKLYGGAGNSDDPSLGSLFSIPTTGGAISLVYPLTASSRVFNPVIGAGDVAYFGAETATSAELLSLTLGSAASPTRVAGVETLRAAPVIGKNDRLYTVNTEGRVTAWVASSLAPLWDVPLQLDLSTRDSSPTLDCRRDAGGIGIAGSTVGNLYFVGTTMLYAFIVDSPGLASNAPWPKYQHDARNTGNSATPVTNCP
jgi:hypothetical protein